MVRLLKPKNINRAIVALALLAPIGYLFGTQIATLAGAHGEELFSEPVYVSQWVEVDNIVDNGSNYKVVFDGDLKQRLPYFAGSFVSLNFDFSFNSSAQNTFRYGFYQSRYYFISVGSFGDLWTYYPSSDTETYMTSKPWVFESASFPSAFINIFSDVSSFYVEKLVPSSTVVENSAAYTDYLFGNMFGKSNFLTDIGANAIGESPKGFAPFGHLLGFIDANMLHIGDTSLGLLGYGYLYWCAHVLILDLICYFMTFFIRLIKSIVDKWEVSQW